MTQAAATMRPLAVRSAQQAYYPTRSDTGDGAMAGYEDPTKHGLSLPQTGGPELDATGTVEYDACPVGTSLFIYRGCTD